MAPGLDVFKWNRRGYLGVLQSPGVEAMLQGRADQVKAAAEADLPPGSDIYILADTTQGRTRVGATVIGVPMRLEKSKRILGRAIDAAR